MAGNQVDVVRCLVTVAGQLAQFCDRAEHNEASERATIVDAGTTLRSFALSFLGRLGVDAIDSYAIRLTEIEHRSPLAGEDVFDADESVRQAKTWRALQRSQARHDGAYHPDVNGLAKIDQLRHYTQHLSKLAWYFQDEVGGTGVDHDATIARVVDMLVFGVKLATVCGQLLPDEPIELTNV